MANQRGELWLHRKDEEPRLVRKASPEASADLFAALDNPEAMPEPRANRRTISSPPRAKPRTKTVEAFEDDTPFVKSMAAAAIVGGAIGLVSLVISFAGWLFGGAS